MMAAKPGSSLYNLSLTPFAKGLIVSFTRNIVIGDGVLVCGVRILETASGAFNGRYNNMGRPSHAPATRSIIKYTIIDVLVCPMKRQEGAEREGEWEGEITEHEVAAGRQPPVHACLP